MAKWGFVSIWCMVDQRHFFKISSICVIATHIAWCLLMWASCAGRPSIVWCRCIIWFHRIWHYPAAVMRPIVREINTALKATFIIMHHLHCLRSSEANLCFTIKFCGKPLENNIFLPANFSKASKVLRFCYWYLLSISAAKSHLF